MKMIKERIKQLEVYTPKGVSGRLYKEANFTFNYRPDAEDQDQVSITMDIRKESYTRGALFPVFEMNLPEGYVRHYVNERLRKTVPIDDMLYLALSGFNGIGRLKYETPLIQANHNEPMALESIINTGNSSKLFTELVEKYLLHTSVGVSGVQPKVVVPEDRGTLSLPSLIIKSGNAEYPNIALNEFICMSIAKEAEMVTPEFWTSEDQQLFIMRRFDITDSGHKLGMEDFSVLLGKSGDKKYEARYETLLKAANLYEIDTTKMFEQIVLSLMVGNGDAHLKNFAILYDEVQGPFELSPLYDVVCTKAYGDETTALSINKARTYPNRIYLEKMGHAFGVRKPEEIIERIGNAVEEVCREYSHLADQYKAQDILTTIKESRDILLAKPKFNH